MKLTWYQRDESTAIARMGNLSTGQWIARYLVMSLKYEVEKVQLSKLIQLRSH